MLLAAFACDQPERDPTFGLDAFGVIHATVYVDRNANDSFDAANDAPLPGITVSLLRTNTDTVMRRTTNAAGFVTFSAVPVGTFQLAVASASGDSLIAGKADPQSITVGAQDTAESTISFKYPVFDIVRARALPPGRRVSMRAVTLNPWTSFSDNAVHLMDSTGFIRAQRVLPGSFGAGDEVRVIGTTALQDGRPVLQDVEITLLRVSAPQSPRVISTAIAGGADAGRLDAALVRISNAAVLGWQTTPTGDIVVAVNDGSGRTEIFVDRSSGVDLSKAERNVLLDVTGVLVPAGSGNGWQIRPRSNADVKITVPSFNIADIRNTEVGRRVRLKAVALHSWAAFGVGTLHVMDATGSLRAINVQGVSVFAGDSVEIVGTTGADAGQVVLRDATATVLATGAAPQPESVSIARVATADAGRLDGALVRAPIAEIADTATVGRDFVFTLLEGTDTARVLLDADGGFAFGQFGPGVKVEVTGLMIPGENGRGWLLKPRGKADVTRR